jgi:hypothetical protein
MAYASDPHFRLTLQSFSDHCLLSVIIFAVVWLFFRTILWGDV